MPKKNVRRSTNLFEETKASVLGVLGSGQRNDQVILIVPSHDRKNQAIPDQVMWVRAASELFADLFGGATAFKAFKGVFRTDEGEILWDEPILLESYVDRKCIEDDSNLTRLLQFAIRMGKETGQHTVAIVVNDFMHFIRIPG